MALIGRSGAPSGRRPSASAGRDANSSAWVWSDAAEARCPQKRHRACRNNTWLVERCSRASCRLNKMACPCLKSSYRSDSVNNSFHVCLDAMHLITNNPPIVIKRPARSAFDKRICALSVNVVNKPIGLISAVISWVYAADPLSVNGF